MGGGGLLGVDGEGRVGEGVEVPAGHVLDAAEALLLADTRRVAVERRKKAIRS